MIAQIDPAAGELDAAPDMLELSTKIRTIGDEIFTSAEKRGEVKDYSKSDPSLKIVELDEDSHDGAHRDAYIIGFIRHKPGELKPGETPDEEQPMMITRYRRPTWCNRNIVLAAQGMGAGIDIDEQNVRQYLLWPNGTIVIEDAEYTVSVAETRTVNPRHEVSPDAEMLQELQHVLERASINKRPVFQNHSIPAE